MNLSSSVRVARACGLRANTGNKHFRKFATAASSDEPLSAKKLEDSVESASQPVNYWYFPRRRMGESLEHQVIEDQSKGKYSHVKLSPVALRKRDLIPSGKEDWAASA